MTFSKLMLSFGVLAVAVASAASSYRVTMSQAFLVGTTEMKAGDYRLEVDGDKVVFMDGKRMAGSATAKIETGDEKFARNTVRFSNGDGKYHLQEIHLGGTKTKLVFEN